MVQIIAECGGQKVFIAFNIPYFNHFSNHCSQLATIVVVSLRLNRRRYAFFTCRESGLLNETISDFIDTEHLRGAESLWEIASNDFMVYDNAAHDAPRQQSGIEIGFY